MARTTNGLIALYLFREGSGDTVYDLVGLGAPNLVMDNPANFTWDPGGGVTCDVNGARLSSVNPTSFFKDHIEENQTYTVEIWFQADQISPSWGRAFHMGASSTSETYDTNFVSNPSGGGQHYLNVTGANQSVPNSTGFSIGRLAHHVGKGSNGTFRYSLDAVENSASYNGSISFNSNSYLTIFNEKGRDRYLRGTVYLVAVYDREITTQEVADNYAAGHLPSPTPPPIVTPGDIPEIVNNTLYISEGNQTSHYIPNPAFGYESGLGTVILIGSSDTNADYSAGLPITQNPISLITENNSDGNVKYDSYCLIANNADTAYFHFIADQNTRVVAHALAIAGQKDVDVNTPLAIFDKIGVSNTGNTTSFTVNSEDTSVANCLAVGSIVSGGNATSFSTVSLGWNFGNEGNSASGVSSAYFWLESPDQINPTGDIDGTKGNTSRWYGQNLVILPVATGTQPVELNFGSIDARATPHPSTISATASLGLERIDATPTVQLLALDAQADFGIEPIDARATVHDVELTVTGELGLGHVDATPTMQALDIGALTDFGFESIDARATVYPIDVEEPAAGVQLDLGHIDARATVQLFDINALTDFGIEPIDGVADVWPLEIDQPAPGTDLELGHIDARAIVHPLTLLAPVTIDLESINARATIYPITAEPLTAFDLESIDARADVWPLEIIQPSVPVDMELGHIDARASAHALDLQVTATLVLEPIDARATVRSANISVIAEIDLASIQSLAIVHPLDVDGQAAVELGHIDALATIYPVNLAGPITERGEAQIMKIIGPRSMIKLLAKGDFIKIIK